MAKEVKDSDKRFDIVYSANVIYTLTDNNLKFLIEGQPIQVIVSEHCDLILQPPKPREK